MEDEGMKSMNPIIRSIYFMKIVAIVIEETIQNH